MTKREFVERAAPAIFAALVDRAPYRAHPESRVYLREHSVQHALDLFDEIEKQVPSQAAEGEGE